MAHPIGLFCGAKRSRCVAEQSFSEYLTVYSAERPLVNASPTGGRRKLQVGLGMKILGGCATTIDFVIYMLLSEWLPMTASKAIAMGISSIFSYSANKKFTFSNTEKTTVNYMISFYGVFVINVGVNMGVNYLFYYMTQRKVLSSIVATGCATIVNYLLQKYLVF